MNFQKNSLKNTLRVQTLIAMIILFGLNSTAHAKSKTLYKVEQCDCIGYSDDLPTFLSDLTDIDIYGEGKSRKAAEKQAERMCVEQFRHFASLANSITQRPTYNGCHTYKTTADGDWEAI